MSSCESRYERSARSARLRRANPDISLLEQLCRFESLKRCLGASAGCAGRFSSARETLPLTPVVFLVPGTALLRVQALLSRRSTESKSA